MSREQASPLKRVLQVGVLLLLTLLAVELVWLGLNLMNNASARSQARLTVNTDIPDIVSLAPLNDFQGIVDHSLFSWNRTPQFSEDGTAQDTNGLLERWQLSGIVHTDSISYALFTDEKGTVHLRLQPGMYLERWKIDSINAEMVVLSGPDGKASFRLKEYGDEPSQKTTVLDKAAEKKSEPGDTPKKAGQQETTEKPEDSSGDDDTNNDSQQEASDK